MYVHGMIWIKQSGLMCCVIIEIIESYKDERSNNDECDQINESINVIIDSNIIMDIYWKVENNSNDKVYDIIVIIKMNEKMANRISK